MALVVGLMPTVRWAQAVLGAAVDGGPCAVGVEYRPDSGRGAIQTLRLKPGGEVRLKYACIIKCDELVKDAAGQITEVVPTKGYAIDLTRTAGGAITDVSVRSVVKKPMWLQILSINLHVGGMRPWHHKLMK